MKGGCEGCRRHEACQRGEGACGGEDGRGDGGGGGPGDGARMVARRGRWGDGNAQRPGAVACSVRCVCVCVASGDAPRPLMGRRKPPAEGGGGGDGGQHTAPGRAKARHAPRTSPADAAARREGGRPAPPANGPLRRRETTRHDGVDDGRRQPPRLRRHSPVPRPSLSHPQPPRRPPRHCRCRQAPSPPCLLLWPPVRLGHRRCPEHSRRSWPGQVRLPRPWPSRPPFPVRDLISRHTCALLGAPREYLRSRDCVV